MEINVHGRVSTLGYGQVCFYILKYLQKAGVKTSFHSISNSEPTQEAEEIVYQALQNSLTYNKRAPSLKIWHEFQLNDRIGNGVHSVLPFFEINKLDEVRRSHLNHADLIFSASYWGTKVLLENDIRTEIEYCPMGVDREIFYDTPIERGVDEEETRFFNLNKIEVRKGHYDLIEAFNKAFEPKDKVKLYMMWDNPFLTPQETSEWVNLYKNSKLGNKVVFIPRLASNLEVAKLINHCHCGVCPTKAEGFGMSLLETLSCGKHLITTDYGAHADFATPKNSRIIHIDNLCAAYDGKWFNGSAEWADFGESQMDQLVEHMRTVHRLDTKDKQHNEQGVITAKEFSWERTANIITNRLFP